MGQKPAKTKRNVAKRSSNIDDQDMVDEDISSRGRINTTDDMLIEYGPYKKQHHHSPNQQPYSAYAGSGIHDTGRIPRLDGPQSLALYDNIDIEGDEVGISAHMVPGSTLGIVDNHSLSVNVSLTGRSITENFDEVQRFRPRRKQRHRGEGSRVDRSNDVSSEPKVFVQARLTKEAVVEHDQAYGHAPNLSHMARGENILGQDNAESRDHPANEVGRGGKNDEGGSQSFKDDHHMMKFESSSRSGHSNLSSDSSEGDIVGAKNPSEARRIGESDDEDNDLDVEGEEVKDLERVFAEAELEETTNSDLGIDLAERHLIKQLRELHNQLDVIRGGRRLDTLHNNDSNGDGGEGSSSLNNEIEKTVDASLPEIDKDKIALNGVHDKIGEAEPNANEKVDGDADKVFTNTYQSPEMGIESSYAEDVSPQSTEYQTTPRSSDKQSHQSMDKSPVTTQSPNFRLTAGYSSDFWSKLCPQGKLIVCAVSKPVNISLTTGGYGWSFEKCSDMFTCALDSLPQYQSGHQLAPTRVEWVFLPSVEITGSTVQTATAKKLFDDFKCHPLFLPSDIRNHFGGICAKLWPILHGIVTNEHSSASTPGTSWAGGGGRESMRPNAVASDMQGIEAYRVVSEYFAQAVASTYNVGDLILVYDFELLLLPQMLRRRIADDLTIGTFFDCPFPPPEFFRKIPMRSNLLRGVLGSDLILFHHFDHARHFYKTCAALLGADASAGGVRYNGRLISIQVCPLGVDPGLYSSASPSVEASVAKLQNFLGKYRIVSSIDALDPIKGLPHKLLAFEDFLKQNEYFRKKVVFVVVIDRSQDSNHFWTRSRQLDKQVNRLVGRINGKFGTADYTPIQYMRYGLPHEKIVALLSMTDVFLATSLSDGVTMSAHKFISAQHLDTDTSDSDGTQEFMALDQTKMRDNLQSDGQEQVDTFSDGTQLASKCNGVLIYSEFAGCAKAMKGALIVNPYDVARVGSAIKNALSMGAKQRTIRYLKLLTYVNTFTALNWGERMMRSLAFSSITSAEFRSNEPIEVKSLELDYRSSRRRLLVFSFEGVLVDPLTLPALSRPSEELIQMMQRFAKDERNVVVLVGASSPSTMEAWGCMRLARVLLVAENGYCCTVVNDRDAFAAENKWRQIRDKKLEEAEAANRKMRERGGDVESRFSPFPNPGQAAEGFNPSSSSFFWESDLPIKEIEAANGADTNVYSLVDDDPDKLSSELDDGDSTKRSKAEDDGANDSILQRNIRQLLPVPDQHESSPWRLCGGATDTLGAWRDELLSVLRYFNVRTPGSFLDDSGNAALTWYYTNADPEFGFRQAKDLHMHLDRMLRAWPLEAVFMRERKCISIGPVNSNIQRLSAFAMRMSGMLEPESWALDVENSAEATKDKKLDKKVVEPRFKTQRFGTLSASHNRTVLELMQNRQFKRVGSVVDQAMKSEDIMILCACCDTISQRMLLPFTERRRVQAKNCRLYTLSVGAQISKAKYNVESHASFLEILKSLE